MASEVDKRRRNLEEASTKPLEENLADKEMWISLGDLIPEVDKRLLPCCPGKLLRANDEDGGVAYYTNRASKSAEYRQIEKLQVFCSSDKREVVKENNNGHQGYIKQHKHKKQEGWAPDFPLWCCLVNFKLVCILSMSKVVK